MSQRGRSGPPPPLPEPLRVDTVDSHCHLDALDLSVDDVLAAAADVGVTRVVTVGDTVPSSRWCAQLAETYDEVVAAVAVHPNETAAFDDAAASEVERLAAQPGVRAVGETGLDYYWQRVEAAVQQDAFRRHIAIAKTVGKALVIHDRDAHADVLRILAEAGAPDRVVFHCFSGDVEMAERCVKAGYVMSFAGTVTFKNARPLRDAARIVPLELLLVETDAPYLTPMPYRGRPNAPHMIPLTVRALAAVKDVDEDTIAAGITETANRVFGVW